MTESVECGAVSPALAFRVPRLSSRERCLGTFNIRPQADSRQTDSKPLPLAPCSYQAPIHTRPERKSLLDHLHCSYWPVSRMRHFLAVETSDGTALPPRPRVCASPTGIETDGGGGQARSIDSLRQLLVLERHRIFW